MNRGAVVVAALAALSAACSAPRAGPPDVLVLVMDTTRADRCSFLGYDRPTTPSLEALAKDSIVFTDAWSPASWTAPAHASLFTGVLPHRIGFTGPQPTRLPDDVPTLATILGAKGWKTGCFTCNGWIAPHSGLTQGFETVERIYLDAGGAKASSAHERALAWMKAQRKDDKRFFAFVNDGEPHLPWTPPPEWEKKFVREGTTPAAIGRARALENPEVVLAGLGIDPPSAEVLRAASDLYDAEVAELDAEIGKLVASMRESGLLDHTFLVILGDHGEGLGDHGWLEHGTFLHRNLTRVPLLVRPPGGVAARTVTDVVRVEDVFPTLLAACGVEAPPSKIAPDGRTLLGDTAGRIAISFERTPEAICESAEKLAGAKVIAPLRVERTAVTDGRHHLLMDDHGGVELFDLAADPKETKDLAPQRADLVQALRAKFDARK